MHKYLYAGGDPVDALDPSGRAATESYIVQIKKVLVAAPTVAIGVAAAVACLVPVIADLVDKDIFSSHEEEKFVNAMCLGVALFGIAQGVAALF